MKEFKFSGCVEIKELLGEKADNALHLLELIEEVPADSIYYHTHSYFLRHVYLVGQYPNDFANWAVMQVRDRVLGEKLGAVTPMAGKTLENIRTELLDIIDRHLSSVKTVPTVTQGEPFHFMKSRIIEIPTGTSAIDLNQFIPAIASVHISAVYNHIFEARLRDKKDKSDFAIWLDEVIGQKELADSIEKIDCYMYSLEDLRKRIIGLCQNEVRGKSGKDNA